MEQTAGSSSSPSFGGQINFKSEDMAVIMCDASCAWSSSEEVEKDLVLHHVTLDLPKGSLVAIIGEVSGLASYDCRSSKGFFGCNNWRGQLLDQRFLEIFTILLFRENLMVKVILAQLV